MILFFDTETTGFVDDRMPHDWPGQPYLVQLAFLFTEDDGTERASFSSVVQVPADIKIPDGAAKVHGITTHISHVAGLYPTAANYIFDRFSQEAHTIVAHNIKFDRAVMHTSYHRHKPVSARNINTPVTFEERLDGKAWICTMEMATPICNFPPTERMLATGFNKPKAPKLEECIKHFFGEELIGAHDALVDVRACARLYFHLQTLKAAA